MNTENKIILPLSVAERWPGEFFIEDANDDPVAVAVSLKKALKIVKIINTAESIRHRFWKELNGVEKEAFTDVLNTYTEVQ